VIEAGVVSSALLSERDTVVAEVAVVLKVTVHAAPPPLERIPGVHEREVSDGAVLPAGPVTLPPEDDKPIAVPLTDAALPLRTPIEVEVTPAATVRLTVATTPLAIVVEFKP
jgi:hypothetical protein